MGVPNLPELKLQVTERQWELLQKGAELSGTSPEVLVQTLVEKEAVRQFHILRCQPKPSAIKSPVGRPRIAPTERQFRELKGFLEQIYTKLRGMLGERDFEQVHREDYERLCNLIETNDLAGLEAFSREQPWQKIRSGR